MAGEDCGVDNDSPLPTAVSLYDGTARWRHHLRTGAWGDISQSVRTPPGHCHDQWEHLDRTGEDVEEMFPLAGH